MLQNMTEDQKNLYGCIDFLVSIKTVTGLPLKRIIDDIIENGKFDSFFELGFFRASGIRPFKLASFLEGNYHDCYLEIIQKLKNNEITILRDKKLVEKIYNYLILNNNSTDLKKSLFLNKDKLDDI